jgi:hypothetical protein
VLIASYFIKIMLSDVFMSDEVLIIRVRLKTVKIRKCMFPRGSYTIRMRRWKH